MGELRKGDEKIIPDKTQENTVTKKQDEGSEKENERVGAIESEMIKEIDYVKGIIEKGGTIRDLKATCWQFDVHIKEIEKSLTKIKGEGNKEKLEGILTKMKNIVERCKARLEEIAIENKRVEGVISQAKKELGGYKEDIGAAKRRNETERIKMIYNILEAYRRSIQETLEDAKERENREKLEDLLFKIENLLKATGQN